MWELHNLLRKWSILKAHLSAVTMRNSALFAVDPLRHQAFIERGLLVTAPRGGACKLLPRMRPACWNLAGIIVGGWRRVALARRSGAEDRRSC
jgi:hypothetical protein